MDLCFKYKRSLQQVGDQSLIKSCERLNHRLNKELTCWKNKLNYNKHWDTAKRISNTYEFIFSSGYTRINLVKKKPLSRAYFKLWEILHDFDIIQNTTDHGIKTAHIADGPGGFIECVCDYCEQYNIPSEQLYGITLKSTDRKIPNWKISKNYLNNFPINLNEGNIYDLNVVQDFVEYVGRGSIEFVTADGGFDFSADFNNQEKQSYKLMFCEIFMALQLQKLGGHFLLKVFDLFSTETITLLACCSIFYETTLFIKPNTSRPANSEKYILFQNFTGMNTSEQEKTFADLKQCFMNNTWTSLRCPSSFYDFLLHVTMYNMYYTTRQLNHLKITLENSKVLHDNRKKNQIVMENLKICKLWCQKYHVII